MHVIFVSWGEFEYQISRTELMLQNFNLQNSVPKIAQKTQSVEMENVTVCLATPSDLTENVTQVGS